MTIGTKITLLPKSSKSLADALLLKKKSPKVLGSCFRTLLGRRKMPIEQKMDIILIFWMPGCQKGG
jgi:hypothetical protein